MGLTHLAIEITNPSNLDLTEEVELLVDSGAVYSVVPRNILENLGITPHAEQQFRLADGSRSRGNGESPGSSMVSALEGRMLSSGSPTTVCS